MRPKSAGRSKRSTGSQSKIDRFRKYDEVASENDSVDTESSSPLMRSAGRPMAMAVTAPAVPAARMAREMSQPQTVVSHPPTAAPTPMKPTWPRETWPPQPVRTTSDTATVAVTTMTVARLMSDSSMTRGRPRVTSARPAITVRLVQRTSGRAHSSRGMGRKSLAACQLLASSPRAVFLDRWNSSAPVMMRNRIGSTRTACPVSKMMALSRMPRPRLATRMSGSFSIRPITVAARALTRMVGPSSWPKGRPTMPARRNTATNDSAVAMIQTMVSMRLTGTPSRAARSALSALARTAMPMLVKR